MRCGASLGAADERLSGVAFNANVKREEVLAGGEGVEPAAEEHQVVVLPPPVARAVQPREGLQ
jgi:hypothetical protein